MNRADTMAQRKGSAARAVFTTAVVMGLLVGVAPFGSRWTVVYEATAAVDIGERARKTENGVPTFTMESDGQVFSAYLRNAEVVRKAIGSLEVPLSPEAIVARVRLSLVGTQIHVTMRFHDAAIARTVATALAQELARYLQAQQIESRGAPHGMRQNNRPGRYQSRRDRQSLPEGERVAETLLPTTTIKPISNWPPSVQRGVVAFFSVLMTALSVRMFLGRNESPG